MDMGTQPYALAREEGQAVWFLGTLVRACLVRLRVRRPCTRPRMRKSHLSALTLESRGSYLTKTAVDRSPSPGKPIFGFSRANPTP